MRKLTAAIFLMTAVISAIAACAPTHTSPYESIAVVAMYGDEVIKDAECTLTNDKGTWHVMTPKKAYVLTSHGELTVVCRKEGIPDGWVYLKSGCNNDAFNSWHPQNNYSEGGRLSYPTDMFVKMGRRSKSATACFEQ